MMKSRKGYSLLVLVIAVTVILIITGGVISTVNISMEEKEINNFIYDLNNIEETAKQYYANTGVIPGNTMLNVISEDLKAQLDENDGEIYYLLDMSKLNVANLHEKDKTYIINEKSLRVYTLEGIRYKNEVYYTVTDELMGITGKYKMQDEDVIVSVTPSEWARKVGIKITIPNATDELEDWLFKWNIGPKDKSFFQSGGGAEFDYGDSVTVITNGVYSFYIKDDAGNETLKNVVIKNIDDIYPTYTIDESGNLVIKDDETGIKSVRYKTLEDYNANVEEFRASGKLDGKTELDFYVLHGKGDTLEQLEKDWKDLYNQEQDITSRYGAKIGAIQDTFNNLSDEEKENERENYLENLANAEKERDEEKKALYAKYSHIVDAEGNVRNDAYVLYIEDYSENGTVILNDKLTLYKVFENFNIEYIFNV